MGTSQESIHSVPLQEIVTQPDKRTALPGKTIAPKPQFETLQRVQDQAETRADLSIRFDEADEAYVSQHESLIDELKGEQRLKKELEEDMTQSLHPHDHGIDKIDHDFTHTMRDLKQRIDDLQTRWGQSQQQIDEMVRRSEQLLDQSRIMVRTATRSTEVPTRQHAEAAAPPVRSPAVEPETS